MAVTTVTPSNNNGYGYVEFKLDGTDYTGQYATSVDLPYANINITYHYDLTMSSFKNMKGTDMYSLDVYITDSKGAKTFRHTDRCKNSTVRLCGGDFNTEDYMVEFWKAVAGKVNNV